MLGKNKLISIEFFFWDVIQFSFIWMFCLFIHFNHKKQFRFFLLNEEEVFFNPTCDFFYGLNRYPSYQILTLSFHSTIQQINLILWKLWYYYATTAIVLIFIDLISFNSDWLTVQICRFIRYIIVILFFAPSSTLIPNKITYI